MMQKRALNNNFKFVPENFPHTENSLILADENNIFLPTSPISSLHYHNRLEIGFCFKGSGIFNGNQKGEYVNSGDIIFFLPGVPHYSQTLTSSAPCICKFAYIDILPLFFSLFKEKETGSNFLRTAQAFDIPIIIRKKEHPIAHKILDSLLLDIFQNDASTEFLASLHLAEFFVKIPTMFFKAIPPQDVHGIKNDAVIHSVESYISMHYNESISISQLCEICYLSESQLRRRYKKIFGVTPIAYLHYLRCNIGAQLLLHTKLPITQIALQVGYLDISEFYKHFHSQFKCSPTTYRKNQV